MEVSTITSYEYFYQIGCFTREEVFNYAKNYKTADTILYGLKKRNLLESVKRNLYVVISRETKLPVATPYEIASKITDTSYVSHRSAFEYYGMTNQVFSEIDVSSSKRFKPFEFDDKTYEFLYSNCDCGIVVDGKVRVTDMERTIIDGIKDFTKVGGLEELLRCLLMVTFIDEEKLLSYLELYSNQFLYQKVGYILSYYRADMKISDDFFEKCKMKINKSFRYLYEGVKDENHMLYSEWQLVAPCNLMKLVEKGENISVDL